MELVVLQITPDANKLKLTWGKNGLWFNPYSVDRDMINDCAEKIRQQLDQLVRRALENDRPGESPACGDILKEIAARGANLRKSLFTSEERTDEPGMIEEWLRTLARPFAIRVVVEPRIHIPWGLIYDGEPNKLDGSAKNIDMTTYQDFWNIKYNLSCVYHRILPGRDQDQAPIDPDSYRVLPVLNKVAFAKAISQLTEAEQVAFSDFFNKLAPCIHTKQDLLAQWETVRNNLGMLFFYCHANQTRLALGQDELDIYDFKRDLKLDNRQMNQPPSFVFLNGCRTAVGDPKGGFLEATGRTGYCGFIGTEAEIPDLFALRFSTAFMYYFFYEGLSILDTMRRLRHQHWPISMLYSICCKPFLTVRGKGSQQSFSSLLESNFSSMQVGSQSFRQQEPPHAEA